MGLAESTEEALRHPGFEGLLLSVSFVAAAVVFLLSGVADVVFVVLVLVDIVVVVATVVICCCQCRCCWRWRYCCCCGILVVLLAVALFLSRSEYSGRYGVREGRAKGLLLSYNPAFS